MYTITITGEREPILFRELLRSLIVNDLRHWRVFIRLEPTAGADKYVELASELLAPFEYTLTVNPRPVGDRENAFRLLEYVFR